LKIQNKDAEVNSSLLIELVKILGTATLTSLELPLKFDEY
jgi:hypothetical protein